MGMAALRSFFPALPGFFFLLLHLACVFFPAVASTNQPPPERRKASSSESSAARRSPEPPVSVRSYIRHILSLSWSSNKQRQQSHPEKHKQLRHYLVHPERTEELDKQKEETLLMAEVGVVSAGSAAKRPFLASQADAFPCASCGEMFNKAHLLDLHQATKHAFSELVDSDAGKNVVRIIFQSGWKGSRRGAPDIRRILKIHHSPRTLARFEECRDAVRRRAAAAAPNDGGGGGEEARCFVDGNERLRFYCATFLCRIDSAGSAGTCGSPFCTVCWIVRHGFSGKEAEGGISMHATGGGAHASLPEDLEREFAFMRIRRAMLVCRVVAGRVGPREPRQTTGGRYDSAAEEDVLLLFDPWAALACFVVVYAVE